jgi:heme O synthase-like polyprenyltransferase
MMIHPSQVDQGSKTTYTVQNDEDLDDILARTNERSRPIERIVNSMVTAYFVPVVTALAILTG